jgi:multimeric flavodoxin WrbA
MTMAKAPNVLVLLGSPRKRGNSAVLAEQIARGAKGKGPTVSMVYLHGLRIQACQGC